MEENFNKKNCRAPKTTCNGNYCIGTKRRTKRCNKTEPETIKNLLADEQVKSKNFEKNIQDLQEKLSKVESDLADSFKLEGTETVVSLTTLIFILF